MTTTVACTNINLLKESQMPASPSNTELYAVELDGKPMDVDVSNATATGKSTLAGFAMPSSNYIDLTLGASGSTYTAPANGWFTIAKNSTSNGQELSITNDATGVGFKVSCFSGKSSILSLPVKRNSSCRVNYDFGGQTYYFRFIYAEGENV